MSILKYKDPKTGEFKRINPYKAELSFVGKDGIVVNKEPNSEEVEISGSGLVQRTTTANRVYTTDKDGLADTAAVAYTPIAYGVAAYDEGGRITTKEPADNLDCTNKKYVADNYVEKVKFTNLEQALYGYILDTTKEAYADLDSAVLKDSVALGDNVYPIADKTRALVTQIEGKTTKMVQLLKNGDFSQGTDNWSKFSAAVNNISFEVVDNSLEVTALTGGTGGDIFMVMQTGIQKAVVGRKYLILVTAKIMQGEGITGFRYEGFTSSMTLDKIDNTNLYYAFITANFAQDWYGLKPFGTKAVGDKWSFLNCQCFDLTAMNREDITTVEQFKAEFPEFYPYENGNIYPAKISGVKFTGKNLLKLELSSTNKCNANIEGDVLKITPTTQNAEDIVFAEVKTHLKAGEYVFSSIDKNTNTTGTQFIIAKGMYGKDNITSIFSKGTKFTLDSESDIYILIYPCLHAELPFKAMSVQMQIQAGSQATAYEPYIEPVSVTLPETYELHGIGDFKDYLEITKNENNELYTLKKVQVIDKHVFDGTETWAVYNRVNFENVAFRTTLLADKYTGWFSRGNLMNLLVNIKTLSADKKGYTHGDNSSNIYISLPNIATPAEMKAHVLAMYEAGTPYIFYGAIATPVETVIATNLTYEQVTAIRHNGGLIEVEDNTNKGYAKPTIKNTVVYRLTATNTAEV